MELLSVKPFSVVGHRGSKDECPENTLPCLRRALEEGADAVEFDVRATKDGHLILLHDETFERVAGLPLRPSDLTLEEVRAKVRVFGTEVVPTLEEALGLVKEFQKAALVEVKEPPTVEKVLRTLEGLNCSDLTAVISFYPEALRRVKELRPDQTAGLIYSKPSSAISEAKKMGLELVLPRWPLATPKAVAFAHRLRLKVVVWVVNDERSLKRTLEAGADALATDRVSWLVKKRAELLQE